MGLPVCLNTVHVCDTVDDYGSQPYDPVLLAPRWGQGGKGKQSTTGGGRQADGDDSRGDDSAKGGGGNPSTKEEKTAAKLRGAGWKKIVKDLKAADPKGYAQLSVRLLYVLRGITTPTHPPLSLSHTHTLSVCLSLHASIGTKGWGRGGGYHGYPENPGSDLSCYSLCRDICLHAFPILL